MHTTQQHRKRNPVDIGSPVSLRAFAARLFVLAIALTLAVPLVGRAAPRSGRDRPLSAPGREGSLFSFVDPGTAAAERSGGGRLVKVNLHVLAGGASRKLRMQLLDGETHEASRTDVEQRSPDDFTWRGKITNPGDVTLTVKNGMASGLIYAPDGVYRVMPTSGPEHRLARVDFSSFPECQGALEPTEEESAGERRSGGSAVTADSASFIELLIVYTPAARRQAGGTAQIQLLVRNAVDMANTAYANSGVTTRLRLAPIQEVNYVESGYSGADLAWLQSNSTVAALRNQFGGDVVSMFCANFDDAGGRGYLMTQVSSTFAPNAFNVVDIDYAVENLTLAHEVGHNQGCDHDQANSGGTTAYPYAHGFYRRAPGFYTVMSYRPVGCDSCFRAPNFSNPNVRYTDFSTGRRYSMGVAGSSENYRVINNTAATVANFRQGTFRLGNDPTDLWATQVSPTRVDLSWRNNVFVDCYYEIERSVDDGPFELIRISWLNQTTFRDLDVIPGQQYAYRVRAASSDWVLYTDYSNDARPVPGCTVSEGAPIALEETVSGALDATDCFTSLHWLGGYPLADRYTFEGIADQLVVISASSSDFDSYLVLLASDGNLIRDGGGSGEPGNDSHIPVFEGGIRLPYTGTYIIEVTSYDLGASGAYTVTLASGDPATAAPETPSDLTVTAVTSDTVELQWTDNAAFEDGYYIEGGVGNLDDVELFVGPDATAATITGLTPGTTYLFGVRAFNAHGESRLSELVTVTTDP